MEHSEFSAPPYITEELNYCYIQRKQKFGTYNNYCLLLHPALGMANVHHQNPGRHSDTAVTELTRDAAAKAGKTLPKPLAFCSSAFLKSRRHKKYCTKKIN